MRRGTKAFSLLEILMAMLFLSLAFLPVYNLFRFGQHGTKNNLNEVTATNYASDLVNYTRELKVYQIDTMLGGKKKKVLLKNDKEISTAFKRLGLEAPPATVKPFSRSMELSSYKGNNTKGFFGVIGYLSDLFNERRSVKNYLANVKVTFPNTSGNGEDEVQLFTIVMD